MTLITLFIVAISLVEEPQPNESESSYTQLFSTLKNEADLVSYSYTVFENEFKLKSKKEIKNIFIFNLSGQLMMKFSDINTNETTFNLKKFTSGVYLLKVIISDDNEFNIKVTI